MGVIIRLTMELSNVRITGGLDVTALKLSVMKLVNGLQRIQTQLCKGLYAPGGMLAGSEQQAPKKTARIDLSEDRFQDLMEAFAKQVEVNVRAAQAEEGHVMEEVRKVSLYFYQSLSKPVKMWSMQTHDLPRWSGRKHSRRIRA
jgi:hypothetical protein